MDLLLIILILFLIFGGRFRLLPVGIWRWHRYWWYYIDRAHCLVVGRTREVLICSYAGAACRSSLNGAASR